MLRSAQHDRCGGDLTAPAWVDPWYILDLEREALLSLLGEQKTRDRMAAMLKTTPKPRDHDFSRAFHRKLVDAIRSGDPDTAEKAARAHMDRSEQDQLNMRSAVVVVVTPHHAR